MTHSRTVLLSTAVIALVFGISPADLDDTGAADKMPTTKSACEKQHMKLERLARHAPHHQKLYLPANNSTQMASSARYIDAASGTFTSATTTDAMISASETTDDVRLLIWGT